MLNSILRLEIYWQLFILTGAHVIKHRSQQAVQLVEVLNLLMQFVTEITIKKNSICSHRRQQIDEFQKREGTLY